jgi:uncharacterized protein YhbP (UPF0306 family)
MDIEKTIREYLPDVLHLSLATSRDSVPWVCEVHFAYDENLTLYFRSKPSRRHSQEIGDNPRVAGNIVAQHGVGEAPRGVYFSGSARSVMTGDEREAAFGLLQARLGLSDAAREELDMPDGHHIYAIDVETFYVFDARDSKPSQKYELPWGR